MISARTADRRALPASSRSGALTNSMKSGVGGTLYAEMRSRRKACTPAASNPKLRLFGQVILGLMWGFGGGGWFGSDYAAMVRGMVASMRSKARR
jgi:hypothetical protein